MKSKYIFKSKKFLLILVVLILLFIFLSLFFVNSKIKSVNKIYEIDSNINNKEKLYKTIDVSSSMNTENLNSYLSIPAIKLYNIKIKNGIDESTLNDYIGHFPNTSNWDGNIGLAAHNRGYKNNFFSKIKYLENGDEIVYNVNNNIKKYKVEKKIEIDSYDWSYLKNTNDNRITLITCVENKENKRLVVQGIEE